MADTAEQNTDWISRWIINDPPFYDQSRQVAERAREDDNYWYLRRWVEFIFVNYSSSSETVRAIAREMTEEDMDTVDWAEVADDLLT